jgi:hypothetical protein
MDPISTALIAAITAGLVTGTKDVAATAVGDLYDGLKGLIRRKADTGAASVGLIDVLEASPGMDGVKAELPAALARDGIAGDPEILAAAEKLLAELRTAAPDAITHTQTVIGDYNAVSGPGGTSTVTVQAGKDGAS